jgi:hypothetical protein
MQNFYVWDYNFWDVMHFHPHKGGSIEPPALGEKNPKNCKKKNTNPKCFQNISHQSWEYKTQKTKNIWLSDLINFCH